MESTIQKDGKNYKEAICNRCGGRGKVTLFISVKCGTCEGTGKHHSRCRACNGTGIFTLKNGRKVQCKACEGDGVYINKHRDCPVCRGKKKVQIIRHVECRRCKGKGKVLLEKKVFNPVLTEEPARIIKAAVVNAEE